MKHHAGWIAAALAVPMLVMPTGAPAVTIEELNGATIHVTTGYSMRVRRAGGEFPSQLTWSVRVKIGPEGKVTNSTTRIVTTPKGPQSRSHNASGTIGKPGKGGTGVGNALWLLDGNKLTLLRTFDTGGFKAEITLNGSTCSVRAVMAREQGAGNTRRTDSVIGGPVEVLSSTPTSSSCRISR